MWTCARLATVRSASANPRPSRNSLKPCFVLQRSGTRARAAAGEARAGAPRSRRSRPPSACAGSGRSWVSRRRKDAVRPGVDGVVRRDLLPQSAAELPAGGGVAGREGAQPVGEVVGVVTPEAQLGPE